MRKLLALALLLVSVRAHAIGQFIGYVQVSTGAKQSGGFNVNTSTVTQLCFDDHTCQTSVGNGITTIGNSIYIGSGAGSAACQTGNVGIGPSVLATCTAPPIGTNTCVGNGACQSFTTGYEDTAYGYQTLSNNTVGFENIAIGIQALEANISGAHNVAIGPFSLWKSTVSTSKTAIGEESGSGTDATPLPGGSGRFFGDASNDTRATFLGGQTGNTWGSENLGFDNVVTIGFGAKIAKKNAGTLGWQDHEMWWGVNYSTPAFNWTVYGSSGIYSDNGYSSSKIAADIRATVPSSSFGQIIACSDCATVAACVSTGSLVNQWALITNKSSKCQ